MSAGHLKALDYAVLQQCIHCGLCLPTCPTYDETKVERNSPRGRIALMRAIADGAMEPTKAFGEEMYYCLGCLACQTACPAGVDYNQLIETARAEAEASGKLATPKRSLVRGLVLRGLFLHPRLLRGAGRLLRFYQASGMQAFVRRSGLLRLVPHYLRYLEGQTPQVSARFSNELIAQLEQPPTKKYRVALLTGCVQDLIYAGVNRATADVLLANGCEVVTPPVQPCCGSLLSHNGETAGAAELARRTLDLFPPGDFDAVITNAGGCGSHLKVYDRLLADDPRYAAAAKEWVAKVKDIHEWLAEIGLRPPAGPGPEQAVTYHESCHLCHGQKVSAQPRQLLRAIPGLRLVELPEASWCCGSAGVYALTQPDLSQKLLHRKLGHIRTTGATTVATGNPGCLLQLVNGAKMEGLALRIAHPVELLAEAYAAAPRPAATSLPPASA